MNVMTSASLPRVGLLLALVFGVGLAGCSKDEEPATTPAPGAATPAAPAAAQPAAEPAIAETPAEIAKRADAAVDAQRLFAPPGDNAFELYLRVLDTDPDQPLARNALTDLFPYAVMHVEQRLSANDADEAERVLALMEKANPQAPALPRLRASVGDSRTRAAAAIVAEAERSERASQQAAAAQQAAQEAARAPAPTPTPVAATPPPAPERVEPTPPPAEPVAAPAPRRAAGTLPPVQSQISPRYPPLALRRRTEGYVEVQFTVLADGRVTDVSVVRSEPRSMFDREAINAMQRWRFQPQPGAEPVRGRRTFDFKLAEE